MPPASDLLRIREDDLEYVRQAAAESAYWQNMHPLGLEALEQYEGEGPVDRYTNRRFTGDPARPWYQTIARQGPFKRCAMLGTSSLVREHTILETNPNLHATFFDISEGPLLRRRELLGKKFPGRVEIQTADLNFIDFGESRFDLIVSSSTIHHVTNLEYLASEVNRALTPDGFFFLEDVVCESRFNFSTAKRTLYEEIYRRDLRREGRPPCKLVWRDTSDLSPFCGVRSEDILPILRASLQEVDVRTAGALVALTLRCSPEVTPDSPLYQDAWFHQQSAWRRWLAIQRRYRPRWFGRQSSGQDLVSEQFLSELMTVGDILTDCGLIAPSIAFATYRKRR